MKNKWSILEKEGCIITNMTLEEIKSQIKTQLPLYEKALNDNDSSAILESGLLLLYSPHYSCLESILEAIYVFYRSHRRPRKSIEEIKYALADILGKANDFSAKLISDAKEYLSGKGQEETFLWDTQELMLQLFLYDNRKEILSWPYYVRECYRDSDCTRFIINAPMGLGKSYAIAIALARSKYSAVIFMPNIDLRRQIAKRIRLITDDVLEIEGIDKENCPHFKKIVKGRDKNLNNKAAICNECLEKNSCPTRDEKKNAYRYRILVTTHAQYEAFYQTDNEDLRLWNCGVEGTPIEKRVLRNLFIIDEDIISSHFFECEEISYKKFDSFCDEVKKYNGTFDSSVKDRLFKLQNRIRDAKEAAYILPVDRNFNLSLSDKIKLGKICSDTIKKNKLNENIWKMVISAIINGCSYDEFRGDCIYFNTGKSFPLVAQPLHVFFDATDVPEWLMNWVFGKGKTARINIDVQPIGSLIFNHTNNSDLPRTLFNNLSDKVDRYLTYLIWKHGERARYFVATTGFNKKATIKSGYEDSVGNLFERKNIRILGKNISDDEKKEIKEEKIKEEIKKENHSYVVIRHYGNLRGTNVAIHCDIGILLGNYKVPDAVEVAWAIPFIRDDIPDTYTNDGKGYLPIKEMQNMFTENGIKIRKYNADFKIINTIVEWRRLSEFEQAIGRTRFLMHDVTIYAVTKEDIRKMGIWKTARIRIQSDENGILIFGDRKDSMYLFSKLAIDKIIDIDHSANLKGAKFSTSEVFDKAQEIARFFNSAAPKLETVGNHVQRYLDNLPKKYNCTEKREGNITFWTISPSNPPAPIAPKTFYPPGKGRIGRPVF